MLALLAAVAVVAAPGAATVQPKVFLLKAPAQMAACKPHGRYQTDWIAPAADPALASRNDVVRTQRLAELPKPDLEKAVMRTVGDCAVPVVVRYSVGR